MLIIGQKLLVTYAMKRDTFLGTVHRYSKKVGDVNINRGNENSEGYQRRWYVGNQGQDNSQADQGARPGSSHPFNY